MSSVRPGPLGIRWLAREPPLAPAAVSVIAGSVSGMLEALRVRCDLGASLRVVTGARRLVVLGEPDDLPWCPGAEYLGWDGDVLLPTALRLSVPVDLLRAAASRSTPLLAILPGTMVFAERPVRPVDVAGLARLQVLDRPVAR